MTEDYNARSLEMHRQLGGKIATASKAPLTSQDDLSLAYTPGVAEPCRVISENPDRAWDLTIKKNSVAVISDGSAVLGLGNIGPEAALPVMEGKCLLFKEYADIDAWPLCLDTQDEEEIIRTVRLLAPVFGGINLEDISAPRCFRIEAALQDLGIPVFHDDQHGTAIVLLAALVNASRIVDKKLSELKIVINGSGAAGIAIARLLQCIDQSPEQCDSVKDILICDRKGIIHSGRTDLNETKRDLLNYTNHSGQSGTVKDALQGADVFIGVSSGGLLEAADIATMAPNAIVFAMANPDPEILPSEAAQGGAAVIGTGRSDFPNQVNNVLAFPGIFRGALEARSPVITPKMKIAAAYALANAVTNPTAEQILPSALDKEVAAQVAAAVANAAQ